MERLKLIFFLLMFLFSKNAIGQTYYYEITEWIDINGARHNCTKSPVYITFIDNKSKCYASDKDGKMMLSSMINRWLHIHKSDMIFRFQYTKDGTHTYSCKWIDDFMFSSGTRSGVDYLTFSSDFSRINYHQNYKYDEKSDDIFGNRSIYVGTRKTEPGKEAPPSTMY